MATNKLSSHEPFAHVGRVGPDMKFEQGWDLHVPFCEARPNAGTHLRFWPASTSFCQWLQQTGCTELGWNIAKHSNFHSADALNLLELGSGLGWLGMVIAKNLPAARLTLTDLPGEATSNLVALVNKAASSNALPTVPQVQPLDWADFAEEACKPALGLHGSTPHALDANVSSRLRSNFPYHTVFGTDLCWDHPTTLHLSHVLGFFSKSALQRGGWPRVIYAHWNRSTRITASLLEQLREQGLTVKVLHPAGFFPKPGGLLEQALQHDVACVPDTCLSHGSASLADAACMDSTTSGSKAVDYLSSSSDDFVRRCEDHPWSQAACPGDDEFDDECDWEAFAFQTLFEDAADSFPDPSFFVFEILAPP